MQDLYRRSALGESKEAVARIRRSYLTAFNERIYASFWIGWYARIAGGEEVQDGRHRGKPIGKTRSDAIFIPFAVLRFVVGFLLILFDLKWLKKAILCYAGLKALHAEEAIYEEEMATGTLGVHAAMMVAAGTRRQLRAVQRQKGISVGQTSPALMPRITG